MKKTTITSAEIISENPDLLTQILVRLPTKTLLKFKCVSKEWLSINSDPQFCLWHTRYHRTNGFLIPTALVPKWIYALPSEFDVVPLKHNSRIPFFDYLNNAPNIKVVQSCYGLFLCKSVVEFSEDAMSRCFICNPSTKKFKELSFPENPFRDSKFYVNMAFDPLKSLHYKVICVRKMGDQPSNLYSLDVYSSETASWSLSIITFSWKYYVRFEDAVFCNGKIHWYGSRPFYYDVDSASLEPLPMPELTVEAPPLDQVFMGECRGILYMPVVYHFFGGASQIDVFEMANDYSRWTLKHRLTIGNLYKVFPDINGDVHPDSPAYYFGDLLFSDVCITQLEKDDDPKVVIWIENKVIFFDFNDETWKSLHDLRPRAVDLPWEEYSRGDVIFRYQSRHAYPYFKNLSSV